MLATCLHSIKLSIMKREFLSDVLLCLVILPTGFAF